MKLDERADVARNRVLDELEGLDIPSATRVARRAGARRRNRLATATLVLAVLVGAVVVTRPDSGGNEVKTTSLFADLPEGSLTSGEWASIPKQGAGLGRDADISALVASDDALLAGGAGIWRSEDGVHWDRVADRQMVLAIASHGRKALAFSGQDVLRSSDDGRSWRVNHAVGLGERDPKTRRPFVTSLVWHDGLWVAGGGASDGYGGIWISSDGLRWQSVLPPNHVGSAEIVEDGSGGLRAFWLNEMWSSTDGREWTPVSVTTPEPYRLSAVAPGVTLAIGFDPITHVTPTVMLRSADQGRRWEQFGDFPVAIGYRVARDAGGWVVAGVDGDHVDAWTSSDTTTWSAIPEALKHEPGGSLSLIASFGTTTVLMGTAPELERFYVIDHHADASSVTACPDSVPRRVVDGWVPDSGDPLPYIDNAVTDRQRAVNVLRERVDDLGKRFPGMLSADIGPGFGAAWQGEFDPGPNEVVPVDDYAIVVRLRSERDCPSDPAELYGYEDGVPLFFVY